MFLIIQVVIIMLPQNWIEVNYIILTLSIPDVPVLFQYALEFNVDII